MKTASEIWSSLIEECNKIINTLSEKKQIQCKKDHHPYLIEEVKEYVKEAEDQLGIAIDSDNNNDEWRLAKALRNKDYKIVEHSKKLYFESILQNSKDL